MKRFALLLACLALPVAAAESAKDAAKTAINLDIGTPPIAITKHSIAQRYSRLVRFYEAGEIGLGQDGLIYLREDAKISPEKRRIGEKLIDLENTERKTLIFTIADGNGRRDAQPEVWDLMRSRWNRQWKSGWWLR
ncbi:MAG: DUF1318 domain-containing protein, partial [Sulfuritalea sp.]|nr:DUF1318 domain-containing protein [Sulfuritalea sp.]